MLLTIQADVYDVLQQLEDIAILLRSGRCQWLPTNEVEQLLDDCCDARDGWQTLVGLLNPR